MTNHTPGPWIMEGKRSLVGGDDFWCGEVCEPGTTYRGPVCMIQSCDHIGGITMAEAQANARLISAAPDLMAALIALADEAKRTGIALSRMGQGATALGVAEFAARKAIAKATGES